MDARIDPSAAYSLPLGSAHVIRNAGGSARDALRSLVISNHALGTEEVLIIKHTRCGLLGPANATNEMVRGVVRTNLGLKDGEDAELEEYDFEPIADLEERVRDDVVWFRGHKWTTKEKIRLTGWVHDTDTGVVRKVVE